MDHKRGISKARESLFVASKKLKRDNQATDDYYSKHEKQILIHNINNLH